MGKLLITFIVAFMSMAFADNKQEKKKEILKLIDLVNAAQTSWTAAYTEIAILDISKKKQLLGAFKPERFPVTTRFKVEIDLPDEFDARLQWPYCSSIHSIKDQGYCGSCWAIATTSATSDRLCIATGGKINVNLSAEYVMTCCFVCAPNGGCQAGLQMEALRFMIENGVITGGDFGSTDGCQPYEIPPTGFSYTSEYMYTPPCRNYCTNSVYFNNYIDDFHKDGFFYVLENDAAQIQTDILINGPNIGSIEMFEDIYTYKSGVYHYVNGESIGFHAMKIIGWGTENETHYWLIANSWSRQFGLNGFIKVKRGVNECGIESFVIGGTLKSNRFSS